MLLAIFLIVMAFAMFYRTGSNARVNLLLVIGGVLCLSIGASMLMGSFK